MVLSVSELKRTKELEAELSKTKRDPTPPSEISLPMPTNNN
jgi:hypothetical protein